MGHRNDYLACSARLPSRFAGDSHVRGTEGSVGSADTLTAVAVALGASGRTELWAP